MSRATFSNDRYTLAFGVDHTPMSCFFQLWEKAAKGENPDDEMPQLQADEYYGLQVHNPKTLDRNPALRRICEKLLGPSLRNEQTIVAIGKACDLEIERRVYELWD